LHDYETDLVALAWPLAEESAMTPETFPEPDDDPAFLNCVDRVIAGLIDRHAPEEFYLIRIANWFDHKWLRFSGIGRVPIHGSAIHTALDEFSQEHLTFPPFTPNRVATQHYFSRGPEGDFDEQPPARLVHASARRQSASNLHRRVVDFCPSAVFVWFSSNSAANRQGSVMVYAAFSGQVAAWYAAFRFDRTWRLGRVKGIGIAEVESYVAGKRYPQAIRELVD
jgi:hypothetical protein